MTQKRKTVTAFETTRGWEGRYKEGRAIVAAQTFDAPGQDNFARAVNFALEQAGLDYKVEPLIPQEDPTPVPGENVVGGAV